MIQVSVITNPFQPVTSRVDHDVPYVHLMTIKEALEAVGCTPERHRCIILGRAFEGEEMMEAIVHDEENVIAMPATAGHGWGKMAAELAVMVAATVVTGGLAAGPLAGLGAGSIGTFFASVGLGNLSAGMASLIGAGIALGGNMLVNAFMGVHGGGNSSPSWDPAGPKTVASGGTPIPKGYGKVQWGGNIIGSYVAAEGQNNYINALVSYGWGPGKSLTNLQINNNSIQNYIGVTYQVRYGTNDQSPIPNFNDIVNGYPQATRVITNGTTGGGPVVINGTGTQTQGLQVVIQFPDGVFYSTDKGNTIPLTVAYLIEYSEHGSGVWKTPIIPDQTADIITRDSFGNITYAPGWVVVPKDTGYSAGVVYAWDNGPHTPGDPWTGTATVTYVHPDGTTSSGSISLAGEWQPCDTNLNQQQVTSWSQGYILFTGADQGALYHETDIYNLAPAQYDVRITKYGSAISPDPPQPVEGNNNRTGDQLWIHSINEVQYQDLAYPNHILCGVRALATDQLSGSSINVTSLVEHDISVSLPAALASFGTDNPAVVAYDMLVAPLYGGNVSPSDIDIPSFAEWAAYCDETVSDGFGGTIKRAVFNGVFDAQGTNLWKCLQKVAMMAYASIVQIGQVYSVVIDQPVTVPAQVFTVGNIIRDSIKDTWIALDDRANRIEVEFPDAARDYRTDEPCAVMLASDINTGADIKPMRVQLLGCTSRAQAWHWAYRKLMSTKLCLLQRSFDVNIAAIACQVGSVIGVQDDITEWAYGGRIQAGSTTTSLIVDRDDLPFSSGDGWTVSIVHPVVQRGAGTIASIAGNVVTFAAALPAGRILNFTNPSGANFVIEATGSNTATVTNTTGLANGQAVAFFDQDVVDTQPIGAKDGGVLTPLAPFLQAPEQDCPWVYGQSAGAFPAKLFTVTNIRRRNDFDVTVDTLVYESGVYADDTPIITETLSVPDSDAAVRSLKAVENYTMANGANGGQDSLINAGWINGPNTVETEIWVATGGASQPLSAETLYLTVKKGTTCQLVFSTGTIVQIRAVGVDGKGNPAPFSTAPIATITVQGAGNAPANVAGLAGVFASGVTQLSWSAASGAANYEIRYNADPANTDWQTAVLLWEGSGTSWSDTLSRLGCYLIKAVSSTSVESITPASWNYLTSPLRKNSIGLAPGQTVGVSLTKNDYDATPGTVTMQFVCPQQVLYLTDGTPTLIQGGTLTYTGLAASTTYYPYLYLEPGTFALKLSAGGAAPDSSASTPDANACSANGNYPAWSTSVTTPSSGGTGGAGTGASFTVSVFEQYDGFGDPYYYVTGITVDNGGSGYPSSGTGNLSGIPIDGTTDVSFTASGGVITSVSVGDPATTWQYPPTLAL